MQRNRKRICPEFHLRWPFLQTIPRAKYKAKRFLTQATIWHLLIMCLHIINIRKASVTWSNTITQ